MKLQNLNSNVFLFKKDKTILIKGPLGVLFLTLPICFQLSWVIGYPILSLNSPSTLQKTYSQLLAQKIRGVTIGFFEILVLHGVG